MKSTTARSALATIANHTLAEHAIHLIYEVDGLPWAAPPLPAFGKLLPVGSSENGSKEFPNFIPGDQVDALRGRYGMEPIWVQHRTPKTGPDLHDHIADILHGEAKDLASLWKLTPQANRFVKSADLYAEDCTLELRRKKQLVLTPSKAALGRLNAAGIKPSELSVTVEDVSLHLFNTGLGLAHAEITFRRLADGLPLSAMELLEAQIALGRFNILRWREITKGQQFADAASGEPFSLGALIRQMVLGAGTTTRAAGRVFTYTFARFDKPSSIEARDAFGLHLARHYSSEYAVSPGIETVGRVADFATVRHMLALEGAATVIGVTPEEPTAAPFLLNFYNTTFHGHYLATALLTVHEHGFLVDRTNRAVHASVGNAKLAEMEKLREQSLMFRTQFRFADISYISRHNAVWHGLRAVFGCQEMLEQLNDDVAEMSSYLAAAQEAKHATEEHEARSKTYWATILGSASLAALTMYTIAKEGMVAFAGFKKWIEASVMPGAQFAFMSGAIVFVITCALAWFTQPRRHSHHEEHDDAAHNRAHAGAKQVLKAAATPEK